MTAQKATEGWLALVATPIGNLEDITLRALRILKEADLIAAEDTRRTRKLCSHFDIHTRLIPYHAHNEHSKTDMLLEMVGSGKRVAVLSDAGTPAVSDPGFLIVRAALARGIEPMVLPGASALTYAIVAAGFPVDEFTFVGYPPQRAGKRRHFLERLRGTETTVFLFESVHRISRLLCDIAEVLGPETRIAVIREATKLHEERIRGTAAEIVEKHGERRWRGEFVVAINTRTSQP